MCSHNISVWHAFINTAVNSRTCVMFGAECGRVENSVWTFLSSGLLPSTLHWESTQNQLHFLLKLWWTHGRNLSHTLLHLFLRFRSDAYWRSEKTSSLQLIGCESVTSVCSSRKFQKETAESRRVAAGHFHIYVFRRIILIRSFVWPLGSQVSVPMAKCRDWCTTVELFV